MPEAGQATFAARVTTRVAQGRARSPTAPPGGLGTAPKGTGPSSPPTTRRRSGCGSSTTRSPLCPRPPSSSSEPGLPPRPTLPAGGSPDWTNPTAWRPGYAPCALPVPAPGGRRVPPGPWRPNSTIAGRPRRRGRMRPCAPPGCRAAGGSPRRGVKPCSRHAFAAGGCAGNARRAHRCCNSGPAGSRRTGTVSGRR